MTGETDDIHASFSAEVRSVVIYQPFPGLSMSCPMNSQSIKNQSVRVETVSSDHDGQRLDNFLARHLKGVPKKAIYRMIRTGQVRINSGRCKPDRRVSTGDQVRIPPARIDAHGQVRVSDAVIRQVREAILFEDADYLVVDKPCGMAVHSGSHLPWGLIDAIRQGRPDKYVELAHRLDRETSGCLVLAKNGKALRHLSNLFRDGEVEKHYLCLMDGQLKEDRVTVDEALARSEDQEERKMEVHDEGKDSITRFRRLQLLRDSTYVEAELLTGRTHQIRAHAAHLGLPLAGDERYGTDSSLARWKKRGLRRLFLHSHHLGFTNAAGDHLTFNAPLPDSLRQVLLDLGA